MRLTKNAKLLWINLLLIYAIFCFFSFYTKYDKQQHEYQITPLTAVSRDVWYEDNYVFTLKHKILLQNQYELFATLQADISDVSGIETIEIYRKKSSENTADGIIIIKDNSENLLTVLSSNSRNDNRNMIYLYEKDGNTMLMTFRINFSAEWMLDYQYEIFRLDINNEPILYAGSDCVFFCGYSDADNFPLSWMTELENYLADAVLLLSTEEDTFRVYSPLDENLLKWTPVLYYEL